MRIVAIIFGILAAIVDLILVIVSIAVPEVSLWGWIVVLTIVTVGLFFSANKVKKQNEARQAAQVAKNTPFMEETAISAIAQGELPVVTGTPVLLEEGEVAHYYAPATKIVTKNKAVGRTGSGAGVRVRVAKGVSVSTGGGSSRTVYGEVTETYSGAIVLTNRRIVFIHNQAGFECKISALTAVTPVRVGSFNGHRKIKKAVRECPWPLSFCRYAFFRFAALTAAVTVFLIPMTTRSPSASITSYLS